MKLLNFILASAITLIIHQITPTLAQSTRWWRIADDCTAEQAVFIRASVDNACTMAVNALTVAGQNDLGSADSSLSPSQAHQDLVVQLFGSFSIGVRNRIGAMFEVRNGILSMRNREAPAGQDLGVNDIKFYCTTKRYVPKIGAGHGSLIYDTDMQAAADLSDKLSCLNSLMWTADSRDLKGNKGYFQIQICPWFLQYATKAPFKWTSDLARQLWVRFSPIRWFLKPVAKLVYSAVDSVALFDKVLLHELTHAHSTTNVRTTDVGGFSGYGWTNCRKLSTVDSQSVGPLNNADSFAIYASACTIMAHGGTVQDDGGFST